MYQKGYNLQWGKEQYFSSKVNDSNLFLYVNFVFKCFSHFLSMAFYCPGVDHLIKLRAQTCWFIKIIETPFIKKCRSNVVQCLEPN